MYYSCLSLVYLLWEDKKDVRYQEGASLDPETPGPDLTLYESGIKDIIDIYCSEMQKIRHIAPGRAEH